MIKTRILAVLAVAAAMLMLAPASFAQDTTAAVAKDGRGRFGGAGVRGGMHAGLLPRNIVNSMTPDQKAQLGTIHENLRSKVQDLNNKSLTQREYRAQLMQIHTDARNQAENLLTPDQKAALASQRKQMMQRRGGPGRTPPSQE